VDARARAAVENERRGSGGATNERRTPPPRSDEERITRKDAREAEANLDATLDAVASDAPSVIATAPSEGAEAACDERPRTRGELLEKFG
jgi:hypothetical protein